VSEISTPVPPTLYKYCPPERIDILEGLQVRFSRPSEFNDAFDTYHLVPRSAAANVKTGRIKLRTRLGVFCLTETADNHLMWVNYAQKHTGFVLGFDANASFFNEEGRALRRVTYQPAPPVFAQPTEDSCFYKSADWTYEQEWRCVRTFDLSESRLVSFEPTMVTEIILGHRMEPWNISRISQCLSTLGMQPAVFWSTPSPSEWRFEKQPKELSLCDHCGGNGFSIRDRG